MLKAVFFDIDNTLYDSAKLASMARMNSVLAMIDAGLDEPEDQILRDLNSVIKKYGPNYPHHYDELLKMYDRLISNGLRIKQWEKLVGLRIHHFFLAVITSEECGCEKPSPEIFRAALEALNVKPDEAVMVGDKYDVDIVGAKALGMHTIWLRKGEPKNSNEINSFAQIPEQIKGLK
jgi:putative hydrolase of the HAD superfamily